MQVTSLCFSAPTLPVNIASYAVMFERFAAMEEVVSEVFFAGEFGEFGSFSNLVDFTLSH